MLRCAGVIFGGQETARNGRFDGVIWFSHSFFMAVFKMLSCVNKLRWWSLRYDVNTLKEQLKVTEERRPLMEDITLFPSLFLSLFFSLPPSSLLSFSVCRCVPTMVCPWRSENNLESWFSHSALFEAGPISAYTGSMNFWGVSCRHPLPPPHRTTDACAIVCLGNLNLGPHACAAIPPYLTLVFRSGMFCIWYLLYFLKMGSHYAALSHLRHVVILLP